MKRVVDTINEEWTKRYDGSPVSDEAALITRVKLLGEDRDCMLSNWRASEKGYNKLDAKVRKLEEKLRILRSQGVQVDD